MAELAALTIACLLLMAVLWMLVAAPAEGGDTYVERRKAERRTTRRTRHGRRKDDG